MRIATQQNVNEQIAAQNEILRRRESITIAFAIKRYRVASERIYQEINKTLEILTNQRLPSETYINALNRLHRLQTLRVQVQKIIDETSKPIFNKIIQDQSFSVGYAQETAFNNFKSNFNPDIINFSVQWNRVPEEALNHLIGYMSNGQPLYTFLQQFTVEVAERIMNGLVTGLTLGKNPHVVARETAKMTDIGLKRAMTIARTEMLRSYREASRESFIENSVENAGVITGWIWHCALDSRCCAACIALHGKFFKVQQKLDGHPNCRCAMVPQTLTFEQLGLSGIEETVLTVQEGSDWFRNQNDFFQLHVLGNTKYNLYKSNRITLDDLISTRINPIWGSMKTEASISKALENASARRAMDG